MIGGNVRRVREARGLTQDALAAVLRSHGLDWGRTALIRAETGDRDWRLGEVVLVALALEVKPDELLAGDGPARIGDSATVELKALRRYLTGGALPRRDEVDLPDVELVPELWDERAYAEELLAGIDESTVRRMEQAAGRQAEVQAARKLTDRLGRDVSPMDLVRAAFDLWRRGLTHERERRLRERLELDDVDSMEAVLLGHPISAPDVPTRRLQALRGHITRDLLDELAPALGDQDTTRPHSRREDDS